LGESFSRAALTTAERLQK